MQIILNLNTKCSTLTEIKNKNEKEIVDFKEKICILEQEKTDINAEKETLKQKNTELQTKLTSSHRVSFFNLKTNLFDSIFFKFDFDF